MRRRWGLIAAGVVVFALVAAQVLIPALGERRIEDRLTEGGGSAEVTLGAFPAARLLFSDGERIEVAARDLDLALDREVAVFDRLDGFAVVQIDVDDSRAGPFDLDTFSLSRDGQAPYHLVATGTTSATALAGYGLERVELPGEGLLDALLSPFLDEFDGPIPVDLDMELVSADGRVQVVSGGGRVAGFSVGPFAELITAAIVVNI
jgi:hypothetical protein